MKIAVLKSVGSGGDYPIPVALITNFLTPFFLGKGWKVSNFAVIEKSVSYIMLIEEGEADDVAVVLHDFLEYAYAAVHKPETREQLFGIEYPLLYLSDLSLVAVMSRSDQDANIFAGYVTDGLVQKMKKEVAELAENMRALGNKFKNF